MRTRSRRLAAVAAFGALVLATACSSSSDMAAEPPATVAGAYILQSVDGKPLPFPIALDGSVLVELTYETLNLDVEGVYDHVIGTQTTRAGVVSVDTRKLQGVFDVSRNAVTLTRAPDGAKATMTYADGRLTLVSGGFTFVYRRR